MDNKKRSHNKLTDDELINRCNNFNLYYIGGTKLDGDTAIEFLCNKHQKFGIQTRKAYDFLRNKNSPCQYCNHSKLKDVFKEEFEEINPTVEILSEYINWNTKVKYRCLICNKIKYGLPSVLLYGVDVKTVAILKDGILGEGQQLKILLKN